MLCTRSADEIVQGTLVPTRWVVDETMRLRRTEDGPGRQRLDTPKQCRGVTSNCIDSYVGEETLPFGQQAPNAVFVIFVSQQNNPDPTIRTRLDVLFGKLVECARMLCKAGAPKVKVGGELGILAARRAATRMRAQQMCVALKLGSPLGRLATSRRP